MLKLHSVSGLPVLSSGKIGLHLNTAGILFAKNNAGVDTCAEAGSVGLSGLSDVVETFADGHVPGFDGTVFHPTTPQAVGGAPPTYTIVSSGLVEVVAVLASGVIPDGTSPGFFTWSGLDQTYDFLEIRGVARGQTVLQNTVGITVYFNNDTTDTNYYQHRMMSTSDGNIGHLSLNTNYCCQVQSLLNDDSNSMSVSPLHLIIPNYAQTSCRKQVYQVGFGCTWNNAVSSYAQPSVFSMQWINASAAINMITVRCDDATTNTFCSGTAIYLLGHKKIWAVTSGILGTAGIVNGRFV